MLVPTGRDGRTSIGFTLDTTKLTSDTELVAFETLLYENNVICEHKDLSDKDQTIIVKKPTISTNLHVNTSYSHLIERTYNCNVTDTLSYVGLSKGSAYKVKGQIIDKKTGKVFIDCSGKAVETEEIKTAENRSGFWEINYSFDSTNLAEGTELVCFEYVYINDTEIAVHKDLMDGNQTVTVVVPTMHISTKARGGTTENKLFAVDDETIIDRVDYSNVEKSFMYRLVGTLMDRTNGEALKDKLGNVITVSEDFVTSGTSGQHEMTFKVDTRHLQN